LPKRLIVTLSLLCCTPAWGAIAFVSASHSICSQSSSSSGSACTLAAPTTAGNTIVAGLTWSNASASINTVAGNATSSYFFPYAQVCGANSCSAILICRNCASLTSVTPNFTQSTQYNLSAEEYSGVAAIGITRTATGTSTSPGITLTTGDPNDWLVAATSSPGSSGIPAAGTGNLENAARSGSSSSSVAGAACDNTVATPGSLSCSTTITSGAWSAVGVELRSTYPTTYIWPDCDSTHPCVIHEKDTVADGTYPDTLASPFNVTVPPTLPGNLMKLTITHPSAKTITSISDDHSNTWQSGATTTDTFNGATTEVRYVCGAATGTSVIAINFNQAMVSGDVVQFSYDEVSGIAPSACGDGGSGSSGSQGVLNAGPITTSSNGDLIFAFGICAANNTEYGNQEGLAMPDDVSAKIAENNFDQFMSMARVQQTAGQISPTIYANAQDVNNNYQMYWNIVAQAFKASSGAGTQPSSIQVVTDMHFRNWDVLGWNSLPSNGNAIVFSSSNPSQGYDMGNLADNYGTAYARTPFSDAGIDPQQDWACFGQNVSARDRIFSFTPDQTETHVEIYTIAGAKNATGTGCVGTTVNDQVAYQGSAKNANITGDPVITPTINAGAKSVIITTSYFGTGPPSGICVSGGIAPPTCTGQSAGVIFNSVYAPGMSDGSGWYTGDPYAFFYTNSTSSRSIDYTMANGISGTGHDGAAIEIFGASGAQVSQLATPTVTVAPSPSSITRVQALSVAVTVSGGAGNPTPTGSVSLTGGGYSSAAATLSGGSATINIPAGSLAVGSDTLTASYAPDAAGSATYNSATGTSPAVTVSQATPTVSAWPTASSITSGQTLASSTLSGGTASVSGTFAWTTPSTVPPQGTSSQSVTFTPADTTDYSTVTGQVSVTVNNQATPTVSAWPSASAITYGQTLASSTLSGGTASVPGSFAWTTPSTVPPAGTPSESVTFTPTNTTQYSAVTGQSSVTVNKAAPTVSAWPTASSITSGQTLASSTLSGGTASVPGSYAWTTPSTVPPQGTSSQSVTFTPTNATDYNTVAGQVSVTVNNATAPTVSAWPTASAITYRQTLASSTLSGGTASVPGSFAWTTPSTVPPAGTHSESVTFTPTNTTQYSSVTGQSSVTVNKAAPTVSAWPSASAITSGQTLASSTLSGGTASVPGTYAWTTPSTVPAQGTSSQSVTFTPTDASDYNTVAGQVSVTVNSSTGATVSAWPSASTITYGQTLASSTLSGGTASVPGSFAWTTPSTAPNAGTPSESVTFTPTNTTQYSAVTGQTSVTVNKATPTISAWPAASAITYGQTLASSALTDGASSVPGAFTWTVASTVPKSGLQSESVTFTPTNTTNYATATQTVKLTVNTAVLTVTATNASVAANQAIPALTYSIAGYVNGDTSSVVSGSPTETTTAKQGSPAGTYPITISMGSLFAANYKFQFVNGTLTITGSGTTTATPGFTPGAGTYSSAQSVSISDATTGAVIYYTTNGSTPTTSSTKYSGSISVSTSETINAIAVASGDAQSAVASAAYVIGTPPTATSKAASSIGNNGATLNGTVTANNATTQYWFAYGTSSSSLTNTTTVTSGLTGTSSKSVSATISGLNAKKTYYFQVVASNAAGTTYGTVLNFTTK
jgi:hypothetical protein